MPCISRSLVFDALSRLTDAEWNQLIDFCHRTQLAIPFALRCHDRLPAKVADRFDQNLVNNAERWRRLKLVYRQASGAFEAAGLEFVTLKGFTHAPRLRGRSAPARAVRSGFAVPARPGPGGPRHRAWARLRTFGRRGSASGGSPAHVDPQDRMGMARRLFRSRTCLWRWSCISPLGSGTEGFAVPGVEDFWQRRQRRMLEDLEFTSLAAIDLPGYASAHALRHLLRGDSRPSHIYEIAYFLEHNSDAEFWRVWRDSHDQPLRRVQAVCFAIARQWFGCRLPAIAQEEIEQLPQPVRAWLAAYAPCARS
jgi:hypothetical protein